jgi:hypothetical protein
VIGETPVDADGAWVSAVLELSEPARAGEWKVDVLYQRDLLERHTVWVR